MKRGLVRSNAFVRAAKKLIKKQPELASEIHAALKLLAADAFQPSLKTHKLKGELQGSWACSAGYDPRIIFKFVEIDGKEAILPAEIGTHDEVY